MSLTAGVPLSKTVDSKPRLVNVDSTVNCIEKNVRHSRQRAMVTGGGGCRGEEGKSKAGLQWGQKWVSGYGGREAKYAIGPAGRIRQSDLCDLSKGSLFCAVWRIRRRNSNTTVQVRVGTAVTPSVTAA